MRIEGMILVWECGQLAFLLYFPISVIIILIVWKMHTVKKGQYKVQKRWKTHDLTVQLKVPPIFACILFNLFKTHIYLFVCLLYMSVCLH